MSVMLIIQIIFFSVLLIIVVAVVVKRKLGHASAGCNDVTLMKNGTKHVYLRHDKMFGKVSVINDGEIMESFQLPHLSMKTEIVFVPKRLKGIDKIQIIRPLVLSGISNGWRYVISGKGKSIDVTI